MELTIGLVIGGVAGWVIGLYMGAFSNEKPEEELVRLEAENKFLSSLSGTHKESYYIEKLQGLVGRIAVLKYKLGK